jgi:hypothetical protein
MQGKRPIQEDAMKLTSILAAISILAFAGCRHNLFSPDLTPPSAPRGVYTSTGDNFIEIFWNSNPEYDVAGYNVFVAPAYKGPYTLIGSSRDTYFVDRDARNGNNYYYAVTAYDYDGNESNMSRDVAYDIPRPEGYNVLLGDYQGYPAASGYDFSTYSVVAYDDQYADMYFEYYSGEYYMNLHTDSDIEDMGPTGSLLDIKTAPASGWSPTHDAILRAGHTYVVWTWDDHYAKFRVTALSPSRVVFDWAYQLQVSNPLLKRNPGSRMPVAATVVVRERGNTLSTN